MDLHLSAIDRRVIRVSSGLASALVVQPNHIQIVWQRFVLNRKTLAKPVAPNLKPSISVNTTRALTFQLPVPVRVYR